MGIHDDDGPRAPGHQLFDKDGVGDAWLGKTAPSVGARIMRVAPFSAVKSSSIQIVLHTQ
jgi:hypothetical protein